MEQVELLMSAPAAPPPGDVNARLKLVDDQIAAAKALLEEQKKEVEAYLQDQRSKQDVLTRGLFRLEGARVMLLDMGATAETVQ